MGQFDCIGNFMFVYNSPLLTATVLVKKSTCKQTSDTEPPFPSITAH